MKLNSSIPLGVLCLFFTIITLFSCSKDSDLMADYIALDPELLIGKYVRSDTYQISIINNPEDDTFEIIVNSGSGSTDNSESGGTVNDSYQISSSLDIVLDVLANDTFKNLENVSIIETSQPNIGSVVISPDNTLIYTPESAEAITDTFTYTAQVVNEDQSVITEEGSVTITVNNIANKNGTIELNTLKAFPSAFGAGINITGGRGQSIYEVTNLNDSGAGSFRDAISSGNRIVIIKVEGIVNLLSRLSPVGADNITVWGQFAPGRGLTLSGQSVRIRNSLNHIFRYLTFQNKTGETGLGSFAIIQDEYTYKITNEKGYYLDHLSTRYGQDQILDLNHRNASQKSTVAYNIAAEALEGHNTGSILGHSGVSSHSGQVTWARNMYYNISHRFPNMAGDGGNFEVYNNYISNWQQRLSAINGAVNIDYFNNYADKGNHGLGPRPINKIHYQSDQWGNNQPLIYSSNNIVETWEDTPKAAPQKSVWAWRKTVSATIDGDPVVDGEQVDSPSLYTTAQQHNFAVPADGYWSVYDVPAKVQASVGHNRGINADGSPGFFRDNKDADYINKSVTGTTEGTYRTSSQWDNSSFTGTTLYSDSDGDYMPDWFENQHAHLNPNEDDKNSKHVDWDFGDYNVVNNAGYTNLEMCAEFYAGGFEAMLGE